MTCKTILVHLDHTARCAPRVDLAASIAKTQGAHLVGLLPKGLLDGTIPAAAIPTGMTDFIAESARYLRERAAGIAESFRARLGGVEPISHEVREVDSPTIDAFIAHGRASDLIVLGQQEASDSSDVLARGLVPQVMLHSGRPVLVVPYAGEFTAVGESVLLAWDGSRAAAVAIREALPLLTNARRVVLISLRHSAAPLEAEALLVPEMIRWLGRHGIRAVWEEGVGEINTSDALLSRASDLGADLIVMGGYAHSRLREMVLGGVTREVLSHMTVPVLVAH